MTNGFLQEIFVTLSSNRFIGLENKKLGLPHKIVPSDIKSKTYSL